MISSDDVDGSGPTSRPRTARERMLAGELCLVGDPDPELGVLWVRARTLVAAYNQASALDGDGLRNILTQLLGSVGEGAEIRQPLYVDFGAHITIGARSFANTGFTALDVGPITIGEDVRLGPHVQLLAVTHPLEPQARREGWQTGLPITIGDNVWLAGGVIVGPGVTIGENTVVGAGSVVTRNLPAGVLAAGSPARVIRQL